MATAGSALGRVTGAALAAFLCVDGCCASAKLESRRKYTSERFGFILWQFYQPVGSPHAILYNGLKPSRGSTPAGALPQLPQVPGRAYSCGTLQSMRAGRASI